MACRGVAADVSMLMLLLLAVVAAPGDAAVSVLSNQASPSRHDTSASPLFAVVLASPLRGGADESSTFAMLCNFPKVCFNFAAGRRSATTLGAVSPPRRKVSTRTRLRRRMPFWLSWIYRPQGPTDLPSPRDMVLLQGFDWELLSDRQSLYRRLAAEMPALERAGINVVWFPPPSSSADPQGYLPGKWYDIPFRTELESAMLAAKGHGIATMVDVVVNHRTAAQISANSSDWTAFEDPDWGEWAIVKDDWKCEPEDHLKFCPDNCTCGARDTGENACYAPDIDHTNPRVQADIIAWLKWLRTDLGFDAFRWDNTKGYAGNYTALYTEASAPLYAVSEYFDTNKDLLTNWIRDSRYSSSLFDFGMRYKLKDSIHQDDYSHMMETFYGPMIWYDKEHSVSFLDNHDTAGELKDRFGNADQIAMGYAVILTHPSVPCVFWQDWEGENQALISDLLEIRTRANINPSSEWKVMHGTKGLYAAFVGSRLAIKLSTGTVDWSPNQDLAVRRWEWAASGKRLCIWRRLKTGKFHKA